MSELALLQAAGSQLREVVRGIGPDDLHRPTPCADWDVRALLVHVVAATDGLVALLRGEQADWEKDSLGDDPAAAVDRSLSEALRAWSAPGAVEVPSQTMPGMRVVDFAAADAVAHLWDLGAALGRPVSLPDELVRPVRERWEGEPAEQGRTYGVFGPRVDVPEAAPELDRLLGLFGRDPGYRPQP